MQKYPKIQLHKIKMFHIIRSVNKNVSQNHDGALKICLKHQFPHNIILKEHAKCITIFQNHVFNKKYRQKAYIGEQNL